MKHFLRLLLAVSIIAFAASMSAVSCGKTAGNNNNSANNSGSGNNGGSTPGPGAIVITNVDANLVKITGGTNILLKLSAFPTQAIPENVEKVFTALVVGNDKTKKAFEIVNDKASEGMVIVAKGNVASAETITTPPVTNHNTAYGDVNYGLEDGIHVISVTAVSGGMPVGLNFFGNFDGRSSYPNPRDAAEVAPNVGPFTFSGIAAAFAAMRPIFWCVATVPTAASVAATDKLTGGHRATCSVANFGGSPYGGTDTNAVDNRTAWFGAAQPFKREFQFAVSAIKTDGKTIADLMPGADAAAKANNFKDGISADEMRGLIAASGHGTPPFKKFNIKIVNDTDFASGCTDICPPTGTFTLRAIGSGVKVVSDTIYISAPELSRRVTVHSDANDANRGFDDASADAESMFSITYDGITAGLMFVARKGVTRNTIALPSTTNTSCSSSESAEETLSKLPGGGFCREEDSTTLRNNSHLGTLLNNTKTTHARGLVKCNSRLISSSLSDTTTFNTFDSRRSVCSVAIVNNAGTAATATIDDAWVGDGGSTTEMDLYAIGVDVSSKSIAQWSDATGYGLAEFKKAHDNAAFKRLLRNNPWGELNFKVKIVTAAQFAALP